MANVKAVRGTRDLLPPETALWARTEQVARAVFARYGFGEIRTPIFEETSLFARSVGEETDIVSKEMYTWEDRERFNGQLLQNHWLKLNQESFAEIEREVKIGNKKADLVVRQNVITPADEYPITQIIEFKNEFRKTDLMQLELLINDFLRHNPTDTVFGRIVVPSTGNVAGTLEYQAGKHTVVVEYVDGNFFLSAQNLGLRPENTAGVVRAYIEHKLDASGGLQKLFYIGPQFRRERPQKGRYRQFFQIGAEVLGPVTSGSESALRDAEVLEMLATLLDELGVKGWRLALNSVGSASDRPKYIAALKAALEPVKARLCADCQRRAETNPLRVLDCKIAEDQEIIEGLPRIADYLDEESKAHFAAVLAALDACGVKYELNPRLVRGLDYYTRTTFEFTVESGLGTQNALLGGGRYDGLSEMLGGPRAPGIGFAIGQDRLVLTLQAQEAEAAAAKLDVYVAPLGVEQNAAALALARELRRGGLTVEVGEGSFRLKKSFEAADRLARRVVLLGEDEVKSGILTVKDFATGEQTKVPRAELAGRLRS